MTQPQVLRDLEKRLRDEPDNLSLRIALAGALREAGRMNDAVELYRSVAIAYRDQGRTQQAIAVCKSTLSIVPDDPICQALLDALEPRVPIRHSSSLDLTPLPVPLPHHVADPTTRNVEKLSERDLRASSEELTSPEHTPSGIAAAARRITASLEQATHDDLAVELDTRERVRIETGQLAKISGPPPTAPLPKIDLDDGEERTNPEHAFEASGAATRTSLLVGELFAPLPPERRGVVLDRFHRRSVKAGATVIRAGEVGHPLVLVARGRLELQRADKKHPVGAIETGQFYGETSLLVRGPASANLVAVTDAELYVLGARDFYEIAGAYPALWAALRDRRR